MTDGQGGCLASNLQALRARSPGLASIVETAAPLPLEACAARSGALTAMAGGSWLHSRYDPEAEGRRIAAEAVATGAELVVILGLGLGHTARAALAAGASIAVVETDGAWLAALLRVADLSDVLADDRCALVLCPQGRGLDEFLDEASPRSIAAIENGATMAAFPEAATALRSQVARYRKKDEINAATLKRFGRLWVRNLARNVRSAASRPGLSSLSGAFSGLPALVMAAGPSLDAIESSLPSLARRMVIICVDTALRSALRAGVQPDFVVVVDPQYWNARHLDRCMSPVSVLVTEAAVWPSVLRFNARRTALCSSIYPLGRYVEERLGPPKGALGAGGSVATTAWDLARVLECAPVYMAGLDLSFPDGRTHARASLFEQRSLAEGTRLSPASNAAFQAMRGGRPFAARANDGSDVTCDERLSFYSTWFERKAAAYPGTPTYNLSARGLAIPGLPYADAGVLARLPDRREEIDERLSAAGLEPAAGAAGDSGKARVDSIVEGLIHELLRLAALADSAVAVAEGATGASGQELAGALAELERIDKAVLDSEARDVVGFLFASVSEAIGGRAKSLEDSLAHTSRLYRAVAESARWHASCLSGPAD
jgi:hypothetical protein